MPVEAVLGFKYLGIHLHASAGFMGAHEVIKGTAVKAMWGMVRQLRDREIESVGIRVHMFNTLVMPIMLYGCEIWATRFLKPQKPLDNPLQSVQTMFARQVGGEWLRKQVSPKLLLPELGCDPVAA